MKHDNNFSTDEVINFMSEVTTQDSCPSCKHEKFIVCGSEAMGAWRFELEVVKGGYIMPMYMLYCANCGYIRSHNAVVVDKWLGRKRAMLSTPPATPEIEDKDE